MSGPDPVDLPELRRLAEAATPGPWGWRGNTDGLIELRGHGPFGRFDGRVVSTSSAEPCVVPMTDEYGDDAALTAWACDDCKAKWAEMVAQDITDVWEDYRCPKDRNLATLWLTRQGVGIEPANRWAVREVPYRTDVASVDHPDAAFIAASGPDVVLALLDRIDALEARFACRTVSGVQLHLTDEEATELSNTLYMTRGASAELQARLDAAAAAGRDRPKPPPLDPSLCNVESTTGWRCILPAGHDGIFHEIGGGYGFTTPDRGAVAGEPESEEANGG